MCTRDDNDFAFDFLSGAPKKAQASNQPCALPRTPKHSFVASKLRFRTHARIPTAKPVSFPSNRPSLDLVDRAAGPDLAASAIQGAGADDVCAGQDPQDCCARSPHQGGAHEVRWASAQHGRHHGGREETSAPVSIVVVVVCRSAVMLGCCAQW